MTTQIVTANVDCVLDAKASIGEGAIWCTRKKLLYWVDIPAGELHSFDPDGDLTQSWQLGEPVGCFALTQGDHIVVALTSGFYKFDPVAGELTRLSGPDVRGLKHRFNDGTVDQRGRFYAGTMPIAGSIETDTTGTLYSLDKTFSPRKLMSGFRTLNGMAFSPDGKTGYISDSFASVRTIWAWDYDLDEGSWFNKRVFFDTREVAGRPDGAAIDSEGCYWMAGVGGWQLVRITPQGKVDMVVPFPAEKPTRIAFGGAKLDTLYVTTIGDGVSGDVSQPQAGGVFALKIPGVTGIEFNRMEV